MSGWHTKRDIIRDLTMVTNGIADIDIDDSYIVIGNEKPKHRIEDEYYDDDPRFEGVDLNHDSFQTSDLDGIKKLLQMCKEYEEMQERERGVEAGAGGDAAPYVVSKLNPLSPPFQPLSVAPGAAGVPGVAGAAGEAGAIGAAGVRLAQDREIRDKIDLASLDTSRRGRTQKNVAIASLLKLHSKGSPASGGSKEDIKDQTTSPAEDDSVKESTEKVNSWLKAGQPTVASPTPPTAPTPEPMFKKKEPTTKPTTNGGSVSKNQQSVTTKVYKPSDYAESLRSRYIQNNNKPKKQPNENVWEKLERELKERDEKIRRSRATAENAAS